MLGILILVGIAVGFYKQAQRLGLSGGLYAFLSIVVWFGFQFLAVYIVLTMNPPTDSRLALIGWGLLGSIIGVAGLYLLMVNAAKNKSTAMNKLSDEIMDDTSGLDEI